MPRFVDYLVAWEGLPGRSGLIADYVLARDGLFVVAENDVLQAQLPVAEIELKGLFALEWDWQLKHGRFGPDIWSSIVATARAAVRDGSEVMLAAVWDSAGGAYRLIRPPQEAGPSHVVITKPVDAAVMEVHSHCRHRAFFSATDNNGRAGLPDVRRPRQDRFGDTGSRRSARRVRPLLPGPVAAGLPRRAHALRGPFRRQSGGIACPTP